MDINLNKDISQLTNIPEALLEKITQKQIWCIANAFDDTTKVTDSDLATIDVGFGTLLIKNTDDTIQYKFIPNSKLEKAILDIVKMNKNPLELTLEKTLTDRIIAAYKDLI